jgi:putative heme-binding domain-containing protein
MLLRNLVKPAASQKPTGEGKKVLWKMKTDLRPALQTDAQDAQTVAQNVQTAAQDAQIDTQDVQTDAQGVQTDAQGVQTDAQDVQTTAPRVRFVAGQAKPGLLADLDATERERILEQVVQQARQAGRQQPPADWTELSAALRAGASPRFSTLLDELSALFGDAAALGQFRATLADTKRAAGERQAALSLLIQAGDAGTAKVLQGMLVDFATPGELRRKALQALASLRDDSTPALLSSLLPKLSANELPDAVNTLASTKEGAKVLLKAVEAKTVPPTALSPFLVRQLAAFHDAEINAGIKSAWGDLNAPKPDLEERKKKFRTLLAPAVLAKADKAKGKILFSAVCGSCHQLFGEGQKVGPELTGSNRANLDYLLDNVLDPNAVIGKDYQLNLFELNDGRVASGVVKEATPAAYRIAMPGGIEQTISVSEVKARTIAKVSTMPEGLFDALPPEALQQLVAYLQSGAVLQPANQTGQAKALPHIEGAIEGESIKVLEITGGKTTKQGMSGFGSEWSGGAQLWWTQGKPDQKLMLAIPVKEAGRYTLYGALTMARDYGVVSITLDGKPVVSTFDGYNGPKVIHTGERDWGTHDLTAGEHRLTFTLAPPNPAAVPSNMVGLDYVRLEKK